MVLSPEIAPMSNDEDVTVLLVKAVDFPFRTPEDDLHVASLDRFFLTHGHLWNENRLPPLGMGTVLAHGHTHVPELKRLGCGVTIFNPGSVSLPKGGSARSFGYFDGERLTHVTI